METHGFMGLSQDHKLNWGSWGKMLKKYFNPLVSASPLPTKFFPMYEIACSHLTCDCVGVYNDCMLKGKWKETYFLNIRFVVNLWHYIFFIPFDTERPTQRLSQSPAHNESLINV